MLAGLFAACATGVGACGSSTSTSSSTNASSPVHSSTSSSGTASAAPLYSQIPASIRGQGDIIDLVLDHPPYQVVGSNGQVTGVTPTLEKAMAKYLGIPFKIDVGSGSLDSVLSGISSGRADIYFGPLVDAAAREQAGFDFVDFMTDGIGFLTPKGKFAGSNSAAVCGSDVAYAQGSPIEVTFLTAFNHYCTTHGKAKTTDAAETTTAALLLALQSGRAQAVVEGADQAVSLAYLNPSKYTGLVVPPSQGVPNYLQGIIIAKSTGLGPVLAKAMQDLAKDGTLTKVLAAAGLKSFEHAPVLNGAAG